MLLSQPKYRQIFIRLEADIQQGQYPEGTFLPSEKEICEEFKTSRITARAALKKLEDEGFVTSIPQRGRKVIWSGLTISKNFQGGLFIGNATSQCSDFAAALKNTLSVCKLGFRYDPLSADFGLNDAPKILDSDRFVIFWCPDRQPSLEQQQWLNRLTLPVIAIGPQHNNDWDCIWFDEVRGAQKLTEYLASLGHRNIAYYHYGKLDGLKIFEDRKRGYLNAMQNLGLSAKMIGLSAHQYLMQKDGAAIMAEQLSLHSPQHRPTAILTCLGQIVGRLSSILNNLDPQYGSTLCYSSFDDISWEVKEILHLPGISHIDLSFINLAQLTMSAIHRHLLFPNSQSVSMMIDPYYSLVIPSENVSH